MAVIHELLLLSDQEVIQRGLSLCTMFGLLQKDALLQVLSSSELSVEEKSKCVKLNAFFLSDGEQLEQILISANN